MINYCDVLKVCQRKKLYFETYSQQHFLKNLPFSAKNDELCGHFEGFLEEKVYFEMQYQQHYFENLQFLAKHDELWGRIEGFFEKKSIF